MRELRRRGCATGDAACSPPHKMALDVVEPAGTGFQGVQHRWKVERTFAWIRKDRRHRRDYARLTVSREALRQINRIRLSRKRLDVHVISSLPVMQQLAGKAYIYA